MQRDISVQQTVQYNTANSAKNTPISLQQEVIYNVLFFYSKRSEL